LSSKFKTTSDKSAFDNENDKEISTVKEFYKLKIDNFEQNIKDSTKIDNMSIEIEDSKLFLDDSNYISDNSEELNKLMDDLYKFEQIMSPIKKLSNNYEVDEFKLEEIKSEDEKDYNEPKISDFKVIMNLGKGGYGQVDLVKKIKTGVKYALKTVNIKAMVIFTNK